MTLVKAKQAFYHDTVGTRAHNEVFEIRDQKVASQLEQQGYICQVEGEQAQQMQQNQQREQLMGQKQALTNEAVSMAHHVQNQETVQHQQQVSQARQQTANAVGQQAQQQQQANQQEETQAKNTNKKATEK